MVINTTDLTKDPFDGLILSNGAGRRDSDGLFYANGEEGQVEEELLEV